MQECSSLHTYEIYLSTLYVSLFNVWIDNWCIAVAIVAGTSVKNEVSTSRDPCINFMMDIAVPAPIWYFYINSKVLSQGRVGGDPTRILSWWCFIFLLHSYSVFKMHSSTQGVVRVVTNIRRYFSDVGWWWYFPSSKRWQRPFASNNWEFHVDWCLLVQSLWTSLLDDITSTIDNSIGPYHMNFKYTQSLQLEIPFRNRSRCS